MPGFRSIFLVDDDPDDQHFFIQAMGQHHRLVLYAVANNGKEALERLAQSDTLPDLIVLDMNMPLMNGLECLAELTANVQTQHIPVVILSTDTEKMKVALHAGARACFNKSSSVDKLCAQLVSMSAQVVL